MYKINIFLFQTLRCGTYPANSVKNAKNANILTFMSRIDSMLSCFEHEVFTAHEY